MLLVTTYYMEGKIKKAIERHRDKKTKASGVEYFAKKFKYYDEAGKAFSLNDFSNSAIVVNYIDAGKESLKLILSQKTVLEKLSNKDIVFFYINKDEFIDIKNLELDSFINKKVYFLIDKNLTAELLSIEKYPYSLIFDNDHRLVGKIDKFQDWNKEDKIDYLSNLAY